MAPRVQNRSGRGLLALGAAGVCALNAYSMFFSDGPAGLAQAVADPTPAPDGPMTRIMAAATQGAVAAAVAALLSACTEPFVNRLLVKRMTFGEAWKEITFQLCAGFFLTTLPTNMLKFPMFEVINMLLSFTEMQGWLRGIVNGFLFCTLMLPVTNFRFRKSMNMPIPNITCLYQAYIPTVSRDILYGWARGLAQKKVEVAYLGGTAAALKAAGDDVSFNDQCIVFGIVIIAACIISSPCNEWRGFTLQPPDRALKFSLFFKPVNYMRSTGIGALIMGISLSSGMAITPTAKIFFAFLGENPIYAAGLAVIAMGGLAKIAGTKPAAPSQPAQKKR